MATAWLLVIGQGCSLAPKSFRGISNPAPLVRARAVPLSRSMSDSAVVPALLSSLDDRDQVVRLAAHEELKKRSGQDFGYVPYAEPEERASAVTRWKQWWGSRLTQEPTRRRASRSSRTLR